MRQQRMQRLTTPAPISPTPTSRTGLGLPTSGYALVVDGQAKKDFDKSKSRSESGQGVKGAFPKSPGLKSSMLKGSRARRSNWPQLG